jgi:serpin B
LLAMVVPINCGDGSERATVGAAEHPDVQALVAGDTRFALDLFGVLKQAEGNLFLSPYSISRALAMTAAGARGATARQMSEVLHLTLPEKRLRAAFATLQSRVDQGSEGMELSVANALWGQRGYRFLDSYRSQLQESYDAELEEVDFAQATEAARESINRWTAEKTGQRITELVTAETLDPSTRLVLTNAIYFKGRWATEFDPAETRPAPFLQEGGHRVEVPMMHVKAEFRYGETADLQVVSLPYKGDALSMVVLLPKRVDGLGALEDDLTLETLRKWLPAESARREIIVLLPKFKITADFRLDDALKALGMTDPFALPPADFSGMTGAAELFISAVVHKAFVSVDEEGTEATAATGVSMGLTGARPSQPPVFRADHPFLFLIQENQSGSVLFLGRVVTPKD